VSDLDTYVARLVDAAPTLTADQLEQLRRHLRLPEGRAV
jgi:hypothetical protein